MAADPAGKEEPGPRQLEVDCLRRVPVMRRLLLPLNVMLLLAVSACTSTSANQPQSETAQTASAEEVGGPALPEDLIGYWQLIEWPRPAMNMVNPWPSPYQYFAFYEDGTYFSLFSSLEVDITLEGMDESKDILGDRNPSYRWIDLDASDDVVFIRITNPEIPGYDEIWGVSIFYEDYLETIKKGDIVMSYHNKTLNRAVYYRLLRRLQ